MSWQDKRKNEFVINTGDGERYVPKSLEFSFQTAYQTATFEFIKVSGSLVVKSQPIGRKFPFKIYFDDTAEDHLETVQRFVESCKDTRPWTIEHPIYDILIVQVSALDFGDNAKNITEVTGVFLETIQDGPAGVSINPLDQIPIQFQSTVENLEGSLQLQVPFDPSDINQLEQDNINTYKKGVPVIVLTEEFETFTNAFNTASSYIDTASATPLLMMRSVQNVLTLPSQFQISTQARIDLLNSVFSDLRSNILGFLTVKSKELYEIKSGSVLAAMCLSAATPLPNDYKNAVPILNIIDMIVAVRSQYISDLDAMQTSNGGDVTSFVANAEALLAMNELVNLTVTALYNLSLSARSERSIICEKETNLIQLAHRVYGLDINDQNINDFYDANGITRDEHLIIEKGRKVVYYI